MLRRMGTGLLVAAFISAVVGILIESIAYLFLMGVYLAILAGWATWAASRSGRVQENGTSI